MPTVVHTLEEKNKNWNKLREVYEEVFLYGKCYAFAIALHLGLGWPIIGLIRNDRGSDRVFHAAVRSPDGRIFDVRGFVPENEFGSPYGYAPPYEITEVSMNYLFTTVPVSEHLIHQAGSLAEILWPDLPWKERYVSGLTAFADELEALCRKHNKWIRSPLAIRAPLLQEGDGNESGYEIRTTVDGCYTINCRINQKAD